MTRHFHTLDVPIAELRSAGRAVSASVNDALLAAAVEGFAAHHRDLGVGLDDLRVTMPVSLRAAGDPIGGNRFAPVRMAVPADIDDAAERMRVVGAIAHRSAAEEFLSQSDRLASALEWLPGSLITAIFGGMLKGSDLVVTDVPGIESTVYLAGAEVLREYAFAPTMGAAVNVSLFTLGTTACIGVVVDPAAIADEDRLVERLAAAFDDVLAVSVRHTTPTG